jgi:hypothetical protein
MTASKFTSPATNGVVITGSTTHNIYGLDPKLGPLADLSGPTPTHALRFDSPALDAGHSGGLTTDQRGLPRPIDNPNTPNVDGGDGSDIGAYEADPNLRIMAIEQLGDDIHCDSTRCWDGTTVWTGRTIFTAPGPRLPTL